jgi:hypothetical protein
MLEKLTTHDVQDVSALFGLTDMCTKAAEGCTGTPQSPKRQGGGSKPSTGAQAQGGGNGNNNNKKKAGGNQPLARAPAAIAAAVGGGVAGRKATNAPVSRPIVMTAT